MSQAIFALDNVKSDFVNNNRCDPWKFSHNGPDDSVRSKGVCAPFVYNVDLSLRDDGSDKNTVSVSDAPFAEPEREWADVPPGREGGKGRFSNIADGLEASVSSGAKARITRILDEVKSLTDVEKLLLYLKLPDGATGEDAYRKTPTSCLHASNRIEQAQAYRWIKSHLEEDREICVPKQEVFQDYRMYCEAHSMGVLSTADFGKVMKCVFPNVKPRRLGQRGQSKYCYGGLRKKIDDQPPTLPEIEICPRKLQDDPDEASELFKSSCQLVCEWAEKLLGTGFDGGVRELAEYLVSNLYVNSKSVAAFTIIAAMQESGLHNSKVSSLFSSKSGGDFHRETQLQLQRKITERELRKEQQKKVQLQREENESELSSQECVTPSPHKILHSPPKKSHSQKKLVTSMTTSNKQNVSEILSFGLRRSIHLTIPSSEEKRKLSESEESMVSCDVSEEEAVFDTIQLRPPTQENDVNCVEMLTNSSPNLCENVASPKTPPKLLEIMNSTGQVHEDVSFMSSSSQNERGVSRVIKNISSDKTLVFDPKSVSARSAFIPFCQTVHSRGELTLSSLPTHPSGEMICEGSEDTVDIDHVLNGSQDEQSTSVSSHSLKADSSPDQSFSDSLCTMSSRENHLAVTDDKPVSANCAKNQSSPSTPRKMKSRFTPIRPKAVPSKSISTMLREQQGHRHDGLDSRPVSKILKERRAKEAQAEVMAQITPLPTPNSLPFPPALKLTGPIGNSSNIPTIPSDVFPLTLGSVQPGKEVVIILNSSRSMATPATILSPVKAPLVSFSATNISQTKMGCLSQAKIGTPSRHPLTAKSVTGTTACNRPFVLSELLEPETSPGAKLDGVKKDLNTSSSSSRPSSACSRDSDTPSFCRKRKSSDKGGNLLVPKRMNSLEEKSKDGLSVWTEDCNLDEMKTGRQTKSCTLDMGLGEVELELEEVAVPDVGEGQFCPDISSVESDALLDSALNIDSIAASSVHETNAPHKVQTSSVGISAFRSSQSHLLKQKQLLDERMKTFMKKGLSSNCENATGTPNSFSKYGTPNVSFCDMVQTMKESSTSQMEVEEVPHNTGITQPSSKSDQVNESELPEDVADFITEAMAAKEHRPSSSSLDPQPFDLAEWHLALPTSFSDRNPNHGSEHSTEVKSPEKVGSAEPVCTTVRKAKDKFTVPAIPPRQDASQLQRLLTQSSDLQKKRCFSLPSFSKLSHVPDSSASPHTEVAKAKTALNQSKSPFRDQTCIGPPSQKNRLSAKDSVPSPENKAEFSIFHKESVLGSNDTKLESTEGVGAKQYFVDLTQHVAEAVPQDSPCVKASSVLHNQTDNNNPVHLEGGGGFISPIQPVTKYSKDHVMDQAPADTTVNSSVQKRRTPVESLEPAQFSPGICPVRRKREMSLDRLSNQTPLSDAGYHSIGASPILNSTPISASHSDGTFHSTSIASTLSLRSESSQSFANETVSESPRLSSVLHPKASTPLPYDSQEDRSSCGAPIQGLGMSPGASAFMPIHGTTQTINRYVTPIRPIVTVANTLSTCLPDTGRQTDSYHPQLESVTVGKDQPPDESALEKVVPPFGPDQTSNDASHIKLDKVHHTVLESKNRMKDPPSYESAVSFKKEFQIIDQSADGFQSANKPGTVDQSQPVCYSSPRNTDQSPPISSNKSKSVLSCILEQTDSAQKLNIPLSNKDGSGTDPVKATADNGIEKKDSLSELSSAFPFSYKLAMLSTQTVVNKNQPSDSILAKLVASGRDLTNGNLPQEKTKDLCVSDSSSKMIETDSEEETQSYLPSDTVPSDCTIIHHRGATDSVQQGPTESVQGQQTGVSSKTTKDGRQSATGCILSTVDINGVTRVFYNSESAATSGKESNAVESVPTKPDTTVSPKSNVVRLPVEVAANLQIKNVKKIPKYTKNVVLPSVNYNGSAPNIDIRNILESPSKLNKIANHHYEDGPLFTVRKNLSDMLEESGSSINEEELQTTMDDLRSLDSQYFDQSDGDAQKSYT